MAVKKGRRPTKKVEPKSQQPQGAMADLQNAARAVQEAPQMPGNLSPGLENLLRTATQPEAAPSGGQGNDSNTLEGGAPPARNPLEGMSEEDIKRIANDPAAMDELMQDPEFQKIYKEAAKNSAAPKQAQLNKIDAEGGVLIQPDPGFVVKSVLRGTDHKVFINITSSKFVEKPHEQGSNDEQTQVRVPLSVGDLREDFDKKEQACHTVDVVANPDTIAACEESVEYKHTVIQMVMNSVGRKYKFELDPKFKLPKMSYQGGSVAYQRMRVTKQSDIQELRTEQFAPKPGETAGASAKASQQVDPGTAVKNMKMLPPFEMRYMKFEGRDMEKWWEFTDDEFDAAVNGFDLEWYKNQDFQEKIKNIYGRKEDSEMKAALEEFNRCVVVLRVSFPQLPMSAAGRPDKAFALDISNEVIKVTTTMRGGDGTSSKPAYPPLVVWFPRPFESDLARASWHKGLRRLTVVLPTDSLVDQSIFYNEFADEIFD